MWGHSIPEGIAIRGRSPRKRVARLDGHVSRLLETSSGISIRLQVRFLAFHYDLRTRTEMSLFLPLSLSFFLSLFLSLSSPSKSNFLLKCTWNDVGPFQGIVMSKYRNCSRDSSDFLFRGCQLLVKGLVWKI